MGENVWNLCDLMNIKWTTTNDSSLVCEFEQFYSLNIKTSLLICMDREDATTIFENIY